MSNSTKPKPRPASGNVIFREMSLSDLPAIYALGETLFPRPTSGRPCTAPGTNMNWPCTSPRTARPAWWPKWTTGWWGSPWAPCWRSGAAPWTYGYLLWLGVDGTVARQGIAAKLFERMTELFIKLGARMIMVDTDAENEPALAFFRSQGFGQETPAPVPVPGTSPTIRTTCATTSGPSGPSPPGASRPPPAVPTMRPAGAAMTSPAGLAALMDRLDPARLRSLLVEAVGVYSPSYEEEPAAKVFAARLEQAGLAVERQPVAPGAGGAPRHNLLVRLGPQPPAMLWVGHMDTIEGPPTASPRPGWRATCCTGLGSA